MTLPTASQLISLSLSDLRETFALKRDQRVVSRGRAVKRV